MSEVNAVEGAAVVAFEDMPEGQKLALFVRTNEQVAADGGGQQDIADALGIDVKRVSQLRQRLTNKKGAYGRQGFTLTPLAKGRKTDVASLQAIVAEIRGAAKVEA
jgi:hypothetical protein